MSREKKFRAWDNKTKQFISIGFHLLGEVTAFNVIEMYLDQNKEPNQTTLERLNDVIVDQYTGLKDENGVEIYESDILDFDEKEWGGKIHEVITMEDITGCWKLAGSLDDLKSFRKVIGNIHENPELLTKPN